MANYITSVGVQQFSVTIASGQTTGTATISAVGSGAFILMGGINPSVANNPAQDFAYLTLTNSTTITATRHDGTTGTVVITGSIVDGGTDLINNVQYGTITISSGSTIGSYTPSPSISNTNTVAHLLGWTSTNTTFSASDELATILVGGGATPTVNASRSSTTNGTLTIGFCLIQFKSAVLNQSIQRLTPSSASAVTSYNTAVGTVTAANTICLYGGSKTDVVTTNIAEALQYGSLTSNVLFTVNVNTAVAQSKQYNISIVEFISGVLNSAPQRGTTTLTGVASNTSSFTATTLTNTALNWLGNTASATTAVLNQAEGQAVLTNGVVTVSKNLSTSNITGSWEVVEFAPPPAGEVGASTGSATATGVSNATAMSFGGSTGVGTATGIGASTFSAVGSAAGSATVSGIGASTATTVGSSSGVATVSGNASQSLTKGVSTGVATVNANSTITFLGVGSSTGSATASGFGNAIITAAGASTGSATASGFSTSGFIIGTAAGTSAVNANSNIIFYSVGNAAGSANVLGTSQNATEYESVLAFMTNAPVNVTATMSNSAVQILGVMSESLPILGFMTNVPVPCVGEMDNNPVSILGSF